MEECLQTSGGRPLVGPLSRRGTRVASPATQITRNPVRYPTNVYGCAELEQMTSRQAPSRPIRITVSLPILTVAFDRAPHHSFPLALFLPPLFSLSPKPITTPPSTLSS